MVWGRGSVVCSARCLAGVFLGGETARSPVFYGGSGVQVGQVRSALSSLVQPRSGRFGRFCSIAFGSGRQRACRDEAVQRWHSALQAALQTALETEIFLRQKNGRSPVKHWRSCDPDAQFVKVFGWFFRSSAHVADEWDRERHAPDDGCRQVGRRSGRRLESGMSAWGRSVAVGWVRN